MEVARDRGLDSMDGQVLSNNTRMLELVESLGFEVSANPDDIEIKQVEAVLQA